MQHGGSFARVAGIGILAAFIGLAGAVQPGQARDGAEDRALVEEVIELYGINQFAEQVPATFAAQLQQRKAGTPAEVYQMLEEVFAEAYGSEAIRESMVASFLRQAERDRLERIRDWLQSPLGRRIQALEAEAGRPEAVQKMMQYAANFQSNPPTNERGMLIVRLDEVVGVTEITVTLQTETLRSMIVGIMGTLPPEKRTAQSEIDQMVANMGAQLAPILKPQVVISLFFTYREASDEELAEYIAYMESEDGRWLNRVTTQALMDAMTAGGERSGVLIAEKAQRSQAQTN